LSGSIRQRLLISNLLILSIFLGLAGAALDRAYRTSSETALQERLQAHVYVLLAAAVEDDAGRMRLPGILPTPDFNRPDSGLYAAVSGEDGAYRWQSGSLLGRPDPAFAALDPGQGRFQLTDTEARLTEGVSWEDDAGRQQRYTLLIAADRQPLDAAQGSFRDSLWAWLGGLAGVLLLVQWQLLRWGLRPLRHMSQAVSRIESGEAARIEGPFPAELHGLGMNLNALIAQNAHRQQRVRHALADLAHSLKTPLAVLRGVADAADASPATGQIREQTQRIDEIVRYQRQRAAVAGSTAVTRPVVLVSIIARIKTSLEKVFHERGIACELEIADGVRVRADEGDLFELAGNLLENAFKHARSRVRVAARSTPQGLIIDVDDDGAGFAEGTGAQILRRGIRADERHRGEGIGLAVVSEIVAQYGGHIQLTGSALGGARVSVILPLDG
jgi:two-component system, OmpR family, sensor histidine kinase PhoQ